MSLVPWKPFSDLDRFFNEDDWFLPIISRTDFAQPAMDLRETEKDVVAEIEIPGFDPEKIDVSVKDGILKIRGVTDEEKEKKEKGYWKKEIRKGSFERIVRLPVLVKENATKATYEKGVLKIEIPKIASKPSSKVKVQVKGK